MHVKMEIETFAGTTYPGYDHNTEQSRYTTSDSIQDNPVDTG